MNIAVDISPLSSGHSVRGVGFYLSNLKKALEDIDTTHSYTFFTNYKQITSADIIHFPYFDPFFITLPLKKKFKTVITIHDLTPLVFPKAFPAGTKGILKWQVQKRLALQSEAIITDSEASKKDIARIMGMNTNKIHVVYLAAASDYQVVNDQRALERVKEKYKLPDQFALYVGDVTWNKNLVRLVKAIKKTNVPLVMVGKALASKDYDVHNPWNHDLVTVQKLCAGDSQISILGFVPTDDLIAIYNLATVFTMPSLYEGFGLPILEAMQSGTPVITSREGSLPEIAGEAAVFVDAYDEDSIKQGIERVSSDTQLQELLRQKGLEQAKKFSWETTARQTIEVYEKAYH